ncbi:hypothetical protein ACT8ZS_08105 [Paenibacillus sp. M.A.Huq-84]
MPTINPAILWEAPNDSTYAVNMGTQVYIENQNNSVTTQNKGMRYWDEAAFDVIKSPSSRLKFRNGFPFMYEIVYYAISNDTALIEIL